MTAKDTTKLKISDALVKLSEADNLDHLSISDIVAETGMNRKSFYYHFCDKNTCIHWVFRRLLAENLTAKLDPQLLVYPHDADDIAPNLPFYVLCKCGVRSLDGSAFLTCLMDTIDCERDFFAQAFSRQDATSLSTYLFELYRHALKSDIETILSNRYLPAQNIDYLATYFSGALTYQISRYAVYPKEERPERIGPFTNLMHESIENAITIQQSNRTL